MQNIIEELEENKKIGFAIVGIFFCFIDFIFLFIYFQISKKNNLFFFDLFLIISIDILQRIFDIFFFKYELSIKSVINFIISNCQFFYIISFITKVLSNMDIDQYEKNTYRIIPTCIFGLMIFPYDRIVRSPSFNANRFISIIVIIFYLNSFIRKKIRIYIGNIYDKIGDNLFLYGILYNMPYIIFIGASLICLLEILKIFQYDELFKSYFDFGIIIFKELIKNCTFILLAGIQYFFINDIETNKANINKHVEIKVDKM